MLYSSWVRLLVSLFLFLFSFHFCYFVVVVFAVFRNGKNTLTKMKIKIIGVESGDVGRGGGGRRGERG